MEMKTKIIVGLSILLILFFWMWFYLAQPKSQTPLIPQPVVKDVEPTPVVKNGDHATTAHGACLGDDETTEYFLIRDNRVGDSAIISVKSKKSGVGIHRFSIPISSADDYHPVEIHNCGVYVINDTGYDFQSRKALANYRRILWKYNYQGTGTEVISDSSQVSGINILGDFRVDPNEKYLVLRRGYLGSPDFAVVIKDIKTLKDVFTLPITEIEKHNPDIVGDIGFVGTSNPWSSDGRYLWADLAEGAYELGFIRVDATDWGYKILPTRATVLGGDALNPDTGDVTLHPGNEWTGDNEMDTMERNARKKKGLGTDLYIYNLFTKKRTLVSHTDEPLAYFHPKWISSTTLEYFMPKSDGSMGERREFVLGTQ